MAPVRLSPPAKVGTEIGSEMDPASVSGVAATLGMRVSARRQRRTLKTGLNKLKVGLRCCARNTEILSYNATFYPLDC